MFKKTLLLFGISAALAVSSPSFAQDDNGGGNTGSTDTRSEMEDSMGADLSSVNVHSDSSASETTEEVGAQAYTSGNDVVFGAGENSPGTEGGRNLLAHELTHVTQQQSTASPQSAEGGSEEEDSDESERRLPQGLRHRDRAAQAEQRPRRRPDNRPDQ